MEALREKNGSILLAILETGKITKKMVLAFSFTIMGTSMKVCGKEIRGMVKELTGEMKAANYAVNTQAIGLMIKSTEEELSFIRMEIDMMDTGLQECHKGKVV